MNDSTTTLTPVLGDWVKSLQYGHVGRVFKVHHWCPQDEAWIAIQSISVTDEQREERWVSILVDKGGSVVQPISTVRVLTADEAPEKLRNDFASMYFRD